MSGQLLPNCHKTGHISLRRTMHQFIPPEKHVDGKHREWYRFYEFNIKKQTAFNWQYLIH